MNNSPTFGFLCTQTGTFYAFDSYEEYQIFIKWMEIQKNSLPEHINQR